MSDTIRPTCNKHAVGVLAYSVGLTLWSYTTESLHDALSEGYFNSMWDVYVPGDIVFIRCFSSEDKAVTYMCCVTSVNKKYKEVDIKRMS